MAELDTDLYGDLYGADDNDFASATETAQDLSKLDSQEPDDSGELIAPQKPAESTSKPPLKLEPAQPLSTIPKNEPSPPPTQQIPTYQQQTPDYNQASPPETGDYQNMNRPVRPSEMKEEG
ncbi:hypothetical protein BJ322DRAFT_1110964 [Thelephora terrestris]|uniref:Uncharacterized protein n=1 Tax=Thelephora terrestris TaxID=56493 RepID=A0A9P6H8V5_9AGAM|nr:hypothetical protein BJ322DRAFT_1110964 [Thelephora terrestris]